MTQPILTVDVKSELDVIAARQRARQLAALCGFTMLDQVRIATVVSELARNIVNYASSGTVHFSVSAQQPYQVLDIAVVDDGPGISKLDTILAGRYLSSTGMGLGILAARKLMERCDIVTAPGQGTRIMLSKTIPQHIEQITPAAIALMVAKLDALPNDMALAEAHQQNRELSDALAALHVRQEELVQLTTRLEETSVRMEALNLELDEKARALQSADRRKDEFVAILSHELRGPLSAASMAAQLMAAGAVAPERTAEMGQIIVRQVGHMSRLVEDLLDVSRVNRGLVAIDRAPVDMREVVTEAVEQTDAYGREKGHEIVLSLAPGACVIQGDKTRLVQVVGNLLRNAIRYTPDGGKITVAMAADDCAVTIRVVDNGIGLPAELMPHLFDLYVQGERATIRNGGGLGLGLALVKSLVEAHDGTVSAQSDGAGLGSTFSVSFSMVGQALAETV
jgi:signal transduction histidine kinase